MARTSSVDEPEQVQIPLFALVISWAIVTIPLLWGVAQTLEKAMLLFQR